MSWTITGPGAGDNLLYSQAGTPSLDLRFASTKSLTDFVSNRNLVTFTRASSGTYVGSDGLIKTAVTNLLLRSEEFDNVIWNKVGIAVTANSTIAPDNSTNADTLTAGSSGSNRELGQSFTSSAGSAYSFTAYLKANSSSWCYLIFSDRLAHSNGRYFDLSNGVTGSSQGLSVGTNVTVNSFSMQSAGNGFWRCSINVTIANSALYYATVGVVDGNSNVFATNGKSIFGWGAQLEQSSTVGEYIPTTSTINSAPRFDHNPTTGESLGLLVEEQRTNSIRNNTMVGAVAGTPGTLPTNWFASVSSGTGVSTSIIGIGTDNGVNYVDIRFNGTPSATSVWLVITESAGIIPAATGQTWTYSAWIKVASGSTSNVSNPVLFFDETAGSTFVTRASVSTSFLTSTLNRYSATRTLAGGATVDRVNAGIRFSVTSGQPIDITLRIGLPQLEQGAFATSVIPTSTVAVTRSADVASISGSNFSSWYRQDEGTVFADGFTTGTINNGVFAQLDDTTTANRIVLRRVQDTNRLGGVIANAGITQLAIAIDGFNSATRGKSAIGYAVDNGNIALNGVLGVQDNTLTLPTLTQLVIGNGIGSVYANGAIRRLTYWPQRLSNFTLQSITQ